MLLDLREKIRNSNPIKYTLITVISIPFALVGIGSYLGNSGNPTVAEVDGSEITQIELEQAYSFQRSQLANMFGGQLPEAFADDTAIREQARDQLINQQVVRNAVEDEGFAVGDDTLARAIQNNPAFQIDGKFDQESYLRAASARTGSAVNFEENLRAQTVVSQFSEGLIQSGFTLPSEAARLDALRRQSRTVDLITLSIDSLQNSIEISDEDVQAYFDENKDSYQFPERAKVQYIELNANLEADNVDVSEEDASEYYTSNRRSYVTPEQRSVSHILLEADGDSDVTEKTAVAEDILARIETGETFADLAKEFSDDFGSADNGGSLGLILAGQMPTEFENATNGLANAGDLSVPVVTDFGVHIIKLDEILPEKGKPFEEVRDDIIATMKRDQANSEFNALLDTLEETAFDFSDELDTAAAETGLELQSTDWIDVDSENGPLFLNPAVMNAVFSDEVLLDGLNSEAIQIAPRHVVVLRVADSEGPRPKTLDDVRDETVATLQNERASTQLDDLVASMSEKVAAGDDVVALADAEELADVMVGESVERSGSDLDQAVVASIFSAAKPSGDGATVKTAVAGTGDRVVYAIRSVGVSEAEEGAPEPSVSNPNAGSVEFTALVNSMRSRAKIKMNDDALEPTAGGYGGGY